LERHSSTKYRSRVQVRFKMTIRAIICNDFGHVEGGASQVALHSAIGLSDNGCDVHLFCAVPPVSPELLKSGVKVCTTNQAPILTDNNRIRAVTQGLWNFRSASEMRALLKCSDPKSTIVHVHTWTKALSSSIVRVALKMQFAVVLTMHDYFLACPNGVFFNYVSNQICPLRAMSLQCVLTNCDSRKYTHKIWRVLRQGIQSRLGHAPADIRNFISVSEESRRILKPYLPHQARLFDVKNPLEVQKLDPVPVFQNDLFVAVGRICQEKGSVLFAEACKRTGVRAMLIGDGPLRAKIAANYPETVITGWLPSDGVRSALMQARALVLATVLYETQGLVLGEAAAMGIPTVVPSTCVGRTSVMDGVTGIWFQGGNVADLAEKIEKLKESKFAATLGQNAFDRFWADPPTIQRHVAKLLDVYSDILRQHRV
jgi:glycosyltransferase involved in cell wall biosynthesis